jgi:Na+/melibiose symporter-like transporter
MAKTSAKKPSQDYIPGVCNIGPAERRKRRMGGFLGTLATLIILLVLLMINAPILWRLVLIIPASGAATGFLQDALHFCAGFGMKGVFNVINSAGITDNVDLEEFRQKDKRKALQITVWSGLIGVAFALLTLLIP